MGMTHDKISHPADNLYIFSDLHLGHDKEFIYKSRGYKSIDEHDNAIFEKWNSFANEETIGFSLGDICLGKFSNDNFIKAIHTMKFKTLYMMPGNHPAGFKTELLKSFTTTWNLPIKKYYNAKNYMKEVIFLPNYYEIYINKFYIVLSHYPIASWNHMSKGAWHLHGHCHGNYKGSDGPVKRLDVGYDVYPDFLNITSIETLMTRLKTLSVDHHE